MTDDALPTVPTGWTPPPDDPAAYDRAVACSKAAFGRIARATTGLLAACTLATTAVLIPHMLVLPIDVALLIGIGATALIFGIASLPFGDADLRAAVELAWNHQLREGREWRAETGTRMPRGRARIERWLERNPSAPGRGVILTVVGRFAEAAALWAAARSSTSAEVFDVELGRERAILYAGGAPDLARLHRLWEALPDGPTREDRRECLAVIDAEASGEDGTGILAAARAESAPIVPRASLTRVAAAYLAIPLIVGAVVAAARLLLS
jgi:hypothetical protein